VDDIRCQPMSLAEFSVRGAEQNAALKRFLVTRVYSNAAILEDREESVRSLDELFCYFVEHPDKMPHSYVEETRHEPVHRIVCDYIAGMTDHFLLKQHKQHLLG
jgi:dGTPase